MDGQHSWRGFLGAYLGRRSFCRWAIKSSSFRAADSSPLLSESFFLFLLAALSGPPPVLRSCLRLGHGGIRQREGRRPEIDLSPRVFGPQVRAAPWPGLRFHRGCSGMGREGQMAHLFFVSSFQPPAFAVSHEIWIYGVRFRCWGGVLDSEWSSLLSDLPLFIVWSLISSPPSGEGVSRVDLIPIPSEKM